MRGIDMRKYYATILVAEDNANDRLFIERGFRKIGVKGPIHLVSSGDEAIAYMKGEGRYSDRAQFAYPSFVMTDLKMPQGDGFSVLDFLKRNPAWAVIPTVVLSASADPDDIKKAYMLGASSYHCKPNALDGLNKLLSVVHDYWMTCEVPEVDETGKQLETNSEGKLGERFPEPQEVTDAGAKPE
jgi:CheY-like chemotaxis protein